MSWMLDDIVLSFVRSEQADMFRFTLQNSFSHIFSRISYSLVTSSSCLPSPFPPTHYSSSPIGESKKSSIHRKYTSPNKLYEFTHNLVAEWFYKWVTSLPFSHIHYCISTFFLVNYAMFFAYCFNHCFLTHLCGTSWLCPKTGRLYALCVTTFTVYCRL